MQKCKHTGSACLQHDEHFSAGETQGVMGFVDFVSSFSFPFMNKQPTQ